jgi:hypothetical protein
VLDSAADVLVPALAAGVIAVLATVAVERLGGVLGGILASVPTTIVPAAIGMHGTAADPGDFTQSMAFIPVGILMNAGYLTLWRVIPAKLGKRSHRHLLAATVAISLGAWLAVATAVVWVHEAARPSEALALAIGCTACAAGFCLGIAANRVPHPAPAGSRRVGPVVLAVRGLAAGTAIGAAVLLSRSGMPVAAGMGTVFPAIFTTIMVATWLSQGAQVPTGAVGPIILGTTSVSAYALLATVLFPRMPAPAAAAACWALAAGCVSLPSYLWIRRVRATSGSRRATP